MSRLLTSLLEVILGVKKYATMKSIVFYCILLHT